MNVFYDKKFKQEFDELPPASQEQFKLIDAQVKLVGLSVLRQNAWVYSKGVGGGFIAWGVLDGNDFLWSGVGVPAKVPAIL